MQVSPAGGGAYNTGSGGWRPLSDFPLAPVTPHPQLHYTPMPYSPTVTDRVYKAPKTLGNQLGRYCVHLDVPVTLIAEATGATRQTVYNWFNGGEILQPYRSAVSSLLNILQTSPTLEEARRRICSAFNLRT